MQNKSNDNRKRLKEIVGVLSKYDIVKGINPQKLKSIIEELGPIYVKLGQVMSMRSDILPKEYCNELLELRTNVKPMSIEEVKSIIELEYNATIEELYLKFDEKPLGSASIAQVHYAILKDGTKVVLKVQRPNIRETICRDINLLRKASKLLKIAIKLGNIMDFDMVIDELWNVSQQEMDFLIESKNAEEFYELNKDIIYSTCPKIYRKYTTSKILVMEYIQGIPIDDINELVNQGYDLEDICEKLCENYIKQIIDDGFFHADPHPGNIRIRNGEIVWIDLGMVGKLSNKDRKLFKSAVEAIVTNDILRLKEVLLALGMVNGTINHSRLYDDINNFINKYGNMEVAEIDLAKVMEDVINLATIHNISMPSGVTMFARGLVTIEGVVSLLAPKISIITIFQNHIYSNIINELNVKKQLTEIGKTLYVSSKKLSELPQYTSEVLKTAAKGQLKINMDFIDGEKPLAKVDRMINKLVMGIVITALLVSSSLLCTSNLNPIFLGIPVLAVMGFILSIIIGGILIYSMFKK